MARKSKTTLTREEIEEREEYNHYHAENPMDRYDGLDREIYEEGETSSQVRERDLREGEERKTKRGELKSKIGNGSLPVLTPKEWGDIPVPPREWYWHGIFPARQVSILTAEGSVGKSLLGLQLGIASAIGERSVLGRDIKPGPVVYLGAEDDEEEFLRRVDIMARGFKVDRASISDFHLIPLAGEEAVLHQPDKKTGQMQETAIMKALVTVLEDVRPVALFLDTAADLFGGDEIKRVQVRQFIGALRKLAFDHNCAVVLLFHPSRSGIESGKGESGSTAWQNSVRSAVYMTRTDKDVVSDRRTLRTTKTNYGKYGDTLEMTIDRGFIRLHDPDAPPSPEEKKRRMDAETEFLSRFVEYTSKASNKPLSESKNSTQYAPKVLLGMAKTSFTKRDFEGALNRLIGEKLSIETVRANGRDRSFLVLDNQTGISERKYGEDK